jgi:CRISPR-associated protein Csm2
MSNRRRQGQRHPPLDLSNLDRGFRTGGNLRGDLLGSIAESYGKRFATYRSDQVSSAQLRRFYGDVKRLQREMQTDEKAIWPMYEARVRMLKSKVAYAAGRRTISRSFEQFIAKCIDQVNDLDDFGDFALFFESVVGYFYGFGGERNR